MIPGIQGYTEQAAELIPRYEAGAFEDKHLPEMHLLHRSPGSVLDVGAGTGADAAWFALHGHSVVAVEPTARLRQAAMALHREPSIEWVDDSLPLLARVRDRGARFDLVLLIVVWMHLEQHERPDGMAALPALLASEGTIVLSLRHGPVPEGRRMFEVSGVETIELARAHGLECVLNVGTYSIQPLNRTAGVTWTRLAFRWPRDKPLRGQGQMPLKVRQTP